MAIPLFALLFLSVPLPSKPALVKVDVHVGDHGPYRFLVDTGAESSLIHTGLAAELGLRPQFRVELVTVNGTRFAPGLHLRNLRLGSATLPDTEILFHDLAEARKLDPAIQGVLGTNALAQFSFQLTPSTGKLEPAAARPATGEIIPFSLLEGRIAIQARMGEETLPLILDSGASHVVLFRTPVAMAKTKSIPSAVSTLDGARNVVPTVWTADMTFSSRLRVGMLPAAIIRRSEGKAVGLLPASVFKRIYVDRERSELVVER